MKIKYISLGLIVCIILAFILSTNTLTKTDLTLAYTTKNSSSTLSSTNSSIISSNSNLFKYIDNEEFYSNNHVNRVTDLENLNTYVFQNSNGTRSIYFLDENVKYVNDIGDVIEKDYWSIFAK